MLVVQRSVLADISYIAYIGVGVGRRRCGDALKYSVGVGIPPDWTQSGMAYGPYPMYELINQSINQSIIVPSITSTITSYKMSSCKGFLEIDLDTHKKSHFLALTAITYPRHSPPPYPVGTHRDVSVASVFSAAAVFSAPFFAAFSAANSDAFLLL